MSSTPAGGDPGGNSGSVPGSGDVRGASGSAPAGAVTSQVIAAAPAPAGGSGSAGASAAAAPSAPPAGGPPGRFAPPPLTGGTLVLGTLVLSLATFMNVLDTTIANVSIPSISGDFGVSPSQGTWVITSFAVANAISVPLTGWLTQRFGPVRLFTSAVLLFVLASLMCGLAPNMPALILFRVIQGAVAGPMIPLSQALLLASYPPARAGMALAMWSMTTLVAPVVGPLLGGWISDNLSWSWIFYINVPVGLVAAWMIWSIYREREAPTRKVPVDKVGLLLLIVWVGALQLTLDKGKELDWFSSDEIVTLAVVAGVGLVFFLIWELGDEHPIVDLRLYGRRNFLVGVIALSLGYALFFGNLVVVPLWLQQYMGYSATDAGAILAPVGVFAILLSPWVGKNVTRFDQRMLTTVGFFTFAVVMWMRSRWNVQADEWTLMVPTIVQGIAVAFFFVPLTSIVLAGLPPERIPAAAGLSNFTRISAGAFGASIGTTMWDRRATLHHAQLTEAIGNLSGPGASALDPLTAQGMNPAQTQGMLERIIDQQAHTMGANDMFYVSAAIFLLLTGVIWFAKAVPRPAAGAAGGGPAPGADAH